jgi:hypothetical protein
MSANATGLIKLVANIGGIAHELGEYAVPMIKALIDLRAKGPVTSTGEELTPAHVGAQIDAALETADAIADTAQAELDKLKEKKPGGD